MLHHVEQAQPSHLNYSALGRFIKCETNRGESGRPPITGGHGYSNSFTLIRGVQLQLYPQDTAPRHVSVRRHATTTYRKEVVTGPFA